MKYLRKELENRKVNTDKLLDYGFSLYNHIYIYEKDICNHQMRMMVYYNNEMYAKVIDLQTNEEYSLVDVKSARGEFVGCVREEYQTILDDIIENCTDMNVYKSKQAKLVIKYVRDKYHDELEHLWKKSPKNAIWRHRENRKWYGAILVISERKLGIDSDREIEIIDLKMKNEDIENIVDHEKYFEGYHMNKKHWITIKLDGSVEIDMIYQLIDQSYKL